MDFLNLQNENITNSSIQELHFDISIQCESRNYEPSLNLFILCFKYFAFESILTTWLFLLFAFFTIILNFIIILLITFKIAYKTVFDKIFIGHSIVDLIVGLFVIPNYLIYTVFGYWPLGNK